MENKKEIEELKEELKSLNNEELDKIDAGKYTLQCPPGYFKKDNKCWPKE